MVRALRIEYEGAFYHVMSHGNGRQWLYTNDAHLELFIQTLADTVKKYNLVIHAAVLMRNHYHLLLETPKGNVTRAMVKLNRDFAKGYNRLACRQGSIFRGRYKAILIEKEAYYLNVLRYICQNPCRGKGKTVDRCEDYQGSYLNWARNRRAHGVIYWEDTKEYFGGGRNWLGRFIQWTNAEVERNPYTNRRYKYLLGTEKWLNGLGRYLKGKKRSGIEEGRKYKALSIDEAELERAVAELFPTDVLNVKALILAEYGGYTAREIGEKLGLKSSGAVLQRICRQRKKAATESRFARKVKRIAGRIAGG